VRPRSLAALAVAVAALAALYWLAQPAPAPAPLAKLPELPALPGAGGAPPKTLAPGGPASLRAAPDPEAHSASPSGSEPAGAAPAPEAVGGDAPEALPLSSIRHRLLRSWGGAPGSGSTGPRELQLVVEPSLGTPELERLLRDVIAHHAEAEILTIRIYDSQEAATYDRHSDGGALAQRHLVASMSRHRRLGVESLRVRGVEIHP
jgi:hypothetical protein